MANRTYNVRMAVVELVEAESAESAIEMLRLRLRQAGFEPYEAYENTPDAFESEVDTP